MIPVSVGPRTVCPCDPVCAWTRSNTLKRVTVRMIGGFELLVLVGLTSRYLDAHTPSLSISSSTRTLGGVSFPGGFRA